MALFRKSELNEEMTELSDLLEQLLHEGLTESEWEFVEDMNERLGKYRNDTFVSDRQWEWLDILKEKYGV